MTSPGHVWFTALVIAALSAMTPVSFAQTAAPPAAEVSKQVDEISRSLMSPYCPGLTIMACPSPGAAALRDEMTDRLSQGEPREAVVASLVERFGSQVTGVPEKEGVGVLAWIIPPVAAAVMLGAIYLIGRRRTRRDEPVTDPVTLERSSQIDEELDKLDP
jgi:cytochrome c-type biogenesis protein CcmH